MGKQEQIEGSSFGNFAVLSQEQNLEDQQLEASRAQSYITVATMAAYPDQTGKKLLEILSPEGVAKRLAYDAYSWMVLDGKITSWEGLWDKVRRGHVAESLIGKFNRYLDELRAANVDLKELNPPQFWRETLNPTKGRSHIKGVAIDDLVAYIQGSNYADVNIQAADFSVKFTGEIAGKIARILEAYLAGDITENCDYVLEEGTTLFLEVGNGKSPILDLAVQFIGEAQQSVHNTSWLRPDGIVARTLEDIYKKGKEVEVITGRNEKPSLKFPPEMDTLVWAANTITSYQEKLVTRGEGYSFPIIQDIKRVMHSKLTLFDLGKWALFGSHNLSERGVNSKTAEWAILTNNPLLVNNLRIKYNEFYIEAFRSHYH